jgi:hypothetical protein
VSVPVTRDGLLQTLPPVLAHEMAHVIHLRDPFPSISPLWRYEAMADIRTTWLAF